MKNTEGIIQSSFRDPSGFLFFEGESIYRQVNNSYKENYDLLMNSGLYQTLIDAKLLIPHEEADIGLARTDSAYKVLKPEMVPFISYPYEWCFSQLKDAALATLEIQKTALNYGMVLKDATAYNIQFFNGKPVFIDTLSFEKYEEGSPWVAYRQFCQHFLAPLALMSYKDILLNQLFKIYIDGVPLELASSLLPIRTRFTVSMLSHIHLHAKSQKYFSDKTVDVSGRKVNRLSLLGIIDNLESAISKLKWKAHGTEWAEYYNDTNYSDTAFDEKQDLVSRYIDEVQPASVWDLGANIGTFSRISSNKGIQTVSFDIDPACVENNYIESVKNNESKILPLLLDLTNPSPSIGWEHSERMSFIERGPVDAVIALALIHHLAISNNVPLYRIANFFGKICRNLIIEFVPKNDSQVQRLLSSRIDIFPDYTKEHFEEQFSNEFTIIKSSRITDSERDLYLMEKKQG